MRPFSTAAGIGAVCLLAVLILLPNLGGYALWDPDEGRHSEVAREVFAAPAWRGWVVPSLNFRPYHDKPILYYWLVSAAYAIGGVNETAARSVSAAAAVVTVLAVYAWAAWVWNAAAGLAAAAVLLTAIEFPALGRYGNLDVTLTLWVTLGLLAVYRWTWRAESGASLAPAAAAAALGMLTKGLVAPVLIGGIGLAYLAVTGQIGLLRRARPGRTALVFAALAGPWYLAAAFIDPPYLETFFVRHHFERFFHGARYLHQGPIYYYVPMLFACFFPWSVLLPATLRATLARGQRGPAEWFCLCWALGVLVFFSLARGKLGTYILPALPPLALLTGRYVSDLVTRSDLSPAERRLVGGGVWVAAVAYLATVPVLLVITARIHAGAWMRTSLLAGVLIPFGLALGVMLRRGRLARTPIVLGAGMLTGLLVFYRWAAPAVSAVQSEAPLAATIATYAPGSDAAPIVGFSVRTSSLLFYLHRPVHSADRPKQLARVLAEHPLVFVVTSPRHVPEILRAGTLYPWHTGGHHVLYATQPLPEAPPSDRQDSPSDG
jgi:4-amino-4-deoxy-L-arabinose transferase-like glycosyltransferase